jgi:hypothetical protein
MSRHIPTRPSASGVAERTPKTALKSSGEVCGVFSRLKHRSAARAASSSGPKASAYALIGEQVDVNDPGGDIAREVDTPADLGGPLADDGIRREGRVDAEEDPVLGRLVA